MSIAQQQAPFQLQRIGLVMESDPDDPFEAWGVLNPASARAHNGELYLFPRVVAEGNYSRIGIARVIFGDDGNPIGVERLGYALEPEEEYERAERTHGGVEDPRVTWVEPLGVWVMAYTALGKWGPRIALAISRDLFDWERLGLMQYSPTCEVDFDMYGNKDGMFFPEPVLDGEGRLALALLHRPTYLVSHPDGTVSLEVPCDVKDARESIWIGYVSLADAKADVRNLVKVYNSELVATPEEQWETLKIGGGTPPIRIDGGWLTYYHGVSGTYSRDPTVAKDVRYSAGALVLDLQRPVIVRYRSPEPLLEPQKRHEQHGIVPNVVFPTAIDQREGGRLDVYYGAADSRIGVACTIVPPHKPSEEEGTTGA